MFYVYILKSLKDGRFYFGQTNNVDKRLKQHNQGKVKSTRYRRPFKLVGNKKFKTRNEARWFEYNLKHHSDKKYKFLKELGIDIQKLKDNRNYKYKKWGPPARRASGSERR
jgi:putative endonuclease